MAQTKESALSNWLPQTLATIGLSTAIGLGSRELLSHIKQKQREKRGPKRWPQMLEKYPELSDNAQKNKEMFYMLNDLYPNLAKHPEAVISILRLAQDYSTGGVDPSTLMSLARAEGEISKARKLDVPDVAQAARLRDIIEDVETTSTGGGADLWGVV